MVTPAPRRHGRGALNCKTCTIWAEHPQEEIPAFLAHVDVCVMPYRLEGGWWIHGFPLKMFEYMALRKPIVSTPLDAVLEYGAFVWTAVTPKDWCRAIDDALVSGDDYRSAIHEFANNNTWLQRGETLSAWLNEITRIDDAR